MAGPDVAVRARSADMVAVASVLCMLATGLQMTRPSLMTAITQDLPTCLGLRPLSATPGSLAVGKDNLAENHLKMVQECRGLHRQTLHVSISLLAHSLPAFLICQQYVSEALGDVQKNALSYRIFQHLALHNVASATVVNVRLLCVAGDGWAQNSCRHVQSADTESMVLCQWIWSQFAASNSGP